MDKTRLDAISKRQSNWMSAERGSIGERVWGKTLIGEDIPALLAEIERLTADRDAWRRRAEAAEADLNHIAQEMFSDNSDDLRGAWYPCEVCKKYDGGKDCYDCLAASYDESKPGVAFEWRGPVAENKEGV